MKKRQAAIGIIGMGAAGSMAGIAAAEAGADVALFDGNEKLGKKIYITGKGRCNVTNATTLPEFMEGLARHPRFLYSALDHWTNEETMRFFESHGLPLKVERGQRVFPVSDKASDVNRVLERTLRKAGAALYFHHKVTHVERKEDGFRLYFETEAPFDVTRLIIATGGKSYPSTGSTGDGFRFARALGHTVTPLFPSLVPLDLEDDVTPWEGISLKNVALHFEGEREFGELVFTHTGISGPIVLTLAARLADTNVAGKTLELDWKPALDAEALKARLIREREKGPNRSLKTLLETLLPKRVIPLFVWRGGWDESLPIHSLTREREREIIEQLKHFSFTARSWGRFEQAVVTRGGVEVKEVNPKDLSSKKVDGLYFAGEVLDVDAKTGGYNLQIAFSTGHLAGTAAAAATRNE